MKKVLYSLIIILCATGCKSYTASMSKPQNNPFSQSLNISFAGVDKKQRIWEKPSEISGTYIENELRNNLINTSAPSMGRIKVEEIWFNENCTMLGSLLPYIPILYPYYALALLGAPVDKNSISMTYRFSIQDKNSNTIWYKSYSYKEDAKIMGIYYGKSIKRMAIDGAKDIMRQFRADYEKDYSAICANLKNAPTREQLAKMPPATVYIVNHPDLSTWGEKNKNVRNGEILYVTVNGQYIGQFQNNSTLKLLVPPGDVAIRLYPNHSSKFYSAPGTYYDGYEKAKKNPNFVEGPLLTVKSGTESYLNIPNTSSLSLERTSSLKIFELAKSNVVSYDMRNPNQKLLAINSPSLQSQKNTYTTSKSAPQKSYSNSTTTSTNTSTYNTPISTSFVDKNIPATNVKSSDMYALIIANENYEYVDPVNYATNDGRIFKEYCVKTLGVPEKQIFYYENATFGKINDGVDKLRYCLNNFDNAKAIVYYCGHGIPDEKTNQAYLIPVDGKGTNTSTCYSLNKLYKLLAATKAQSITYFLDACFTGANKEGSMLIAARGVARAPEKEVLTGKTIVFSASSGDETAMTLEEEGHGLFTYYLLKKLQETEGNVTYGDLANYINQNVKKDAFLINEKPQTPIVATSPAVVNTWKTMKLK